MTQLEARDLAIGYGSTTIARDLNLALAPGTVTCLLGPNGVGKTTLFKTLLGLIPAISGSVLAGGEDITQLSRERIARQIAYVPQAAPSEFSYTVLDLVMMGRTAYLGTFGTPRKADYEEAACALDLLGIGALAERDSTRISGGQRQLALIARALAQKANVIMMDEPTASLDLGNRSLVLDTICNLSASGLTIVLSTHEPEHAFLVADQVAILGRERFVTGTPATTMTSDELSRLYGLPITIEQTSSGRSVVVPARKNLPT